MTDQDIRWHQRLDSFDKALSQLSDAVKLSNERELSSLEEQGLIQSFEYNYELSWNLIKDFYENQGETELQGSRDAIRLAFKRGLFENGDTWMAMIKSRMLTSHTYNKETANEIADQIKNNYFEEFQKLSITFHHLKEK